MKRILTFSIILVLFLFQIGCANQLVSPDRPLNKQESQANEMVNLYGNLMTSGWLGSEVSGGMMPNEPRVRGGVEPYHPFCGGHN